MVATCPALKHPLVCTCNLNSVFLPVNSTLCTPLQAACYHNFSVLHRILIISKSCKIHFQIVLCSKIALLVVQCLILFFCVAKANLSFQLVLLHLVVWAECKGIKMETTLYDIFRFLLKSINLTGGASAQIA